jgi:CCR4-NOT transcription complex subunit 1
VFCFAEQQCHSSATEILKVQPDLDNKDIATWRSLDLIETLLYLADNGHSMQVSRTCNANYVVLEVSAASGRSNF